MYSGSSTPGPGHQILPTSTSGVPISTGITPYINYWGDADPDAWNITDSYSIAHVISGNNANAKSDTDTYSWSNANTNSWSIADAHPWSDTNVSAHTDALLGFGMCAILIDLE